MRYKSVSYPNPVFRLNQTVNLTSYNYLKIIVRGDKLVVGVSPNGGIVNRSSLAACSPEYDSNSAGTVYVTYQV